MSINIKSIDASITCDVCGKTTPLSLKDHDDLPQIKSFQNFFIQIKLENPKEDDGFLIRKCPQNIRTCGRMITCESCAEEIDASEHILDKKYSKEKESVVSCLRTKHGYTPVTKEDKIESIYPNL